MSFFTSTAQANGFWAQVLQNLGAPTTQANLDFFNAWLPYENSTAQWNPLGDTQDRTGTPGLSNFNSVGVKNYPNASVAAKEYALELQAIAPSTVGMLRQGTGNYGGNSGIAAEIAKWGTHGFANVISGGGQGTPATSPGGSAGVAVPNAPSGASTSSGGCKTLADSVSGGIPLLSGAAGFFGWIAQPCVFSRLLIQAGSVLLILFGLHYVGGRAAGPANVILSRVPFAGRAV